MSRCDADLILHSGSVHTMDAAQPLAQALACSGGRWLVVGSDQEVMTLRGPRTRCVDLRGRAVLPGFIDSHMHFTEWAVGRRQIDLRDTRSPDEVLELVRRRAARQEPGSWIVGSGFNSNLWSAAIQPHRQLLDRVTMRHPVLLGSKDMHSCWVNSYALELAGINGGCADPPGGRIERDPSTGEPTGVVSERARDPLWRIVPKPTTAEAEAAIEEALPLAWAAGLTGVHEILDSPDALALHTWQRRRRRLGGTGLRVYQHFPADHLQDAINLGVETGLGDEWLRLGGVKLFADGALGSRTAHLLEPYQGSNDKGVAVLGADELHEIIGHAQRANIAVSVHAIGDAAVRAVLDGLEAVLQQDRRPEPRHRVEHAQLVHPNDLPRFRQLGVIASMQPIHAISDMLMAEEHWGTARCQHAYAWHSIVQSGAHLCFGSDAPVESFSVLEGLRAAVTRRRPDDSPGPAGWIPEQRLAIEQAVRAYTTGAAYASGEESLKGRLTPGLLADAVVLSHDILSRPETLAESRVELTVLGGQVVFELDGGNAP